MLYDNVEVWQETDPNPKRCWECGEHSVYLESRPTGLGGKCQVWGYCVEHWALYVHATNNPISHQYHDADRWIYGESA